MLVCIGYFSINLVFTFLCTIHYVGHLTCMLISRIWTAKKRNEEELLKVLNSSLQRMLGIPEKTVCRKTGHICVQRALQFLILQWTWQIPRRQLGSGGVVVSAVPIDRSNGAEELRQSKNSWQGTPVIMSLWWLLALAILRDYSICHPKYGGKSDNIFVNCCYVFNGLL